MTFRTARVRATRHTLPALACISEHTRATHPTKSGPMSCVLTICISQAHIPSPHVRPSACQYSVCFREPSSTPPHSTKQRASSVACPSHHNIQQSRSVRIPAESRRQMAPALRATTARRKSATSSHAWCRALRQYILSMQRTSCVDFDHERCISTCLASCATWRFKSRSEFDGSASRSIFSMRANVELVSDTDFSSCCFA